MAILSAVELQELRRRCREEFGSSFSVDYDRATINDALQAIEDWYEANKSSGSAAIDTATSPYTFTSPQKKTLFMYWNLQKFSREKAG